MVNDDDCGDDDAGEHETVYRCRVTPGKGRKKKSRGRENID